MGLKRSLGGWVGERGAKVKTPALTLSRGQLWEGVEQSEDWAAHAPADGRLLDQFKYELGAGARVGSGDILKGDAD